MDFLNTSLLDPVKFAETIATVIATPSSPTTQRVDFVLRSESLQVVRGEILEVPMPNVERPTSIVLLVVQEIHKSNAYFSSADVAKDVGSVSSSTEHLSALFPTDEWATTVVTSRPLGSYSGQTGRIQRVQFPVSPGNTVQRARSDLLSHFLGLVPEGEGLNLGSIATAATPLVVDVTRLVRKHLAILAISGAGKSYTTSVLLEELLSRNAEVGRLPVLVVDPHGEYKGFADVLDKPSLATVYPGRFLSIQTNDLTAWRLREYAPDISPVQVRELDRIMTGLRRETPVFSFKDLLNAVTQSEIGIRTKESLLGWLDNLDRTRLFGTNANPDLATIVRPGRISIFDLSDFQSVRQKQIMCAHIARVVFELRRQGTIPPFLLVVEEAHQFCPENGVAISKGILETIAREGRKFFASLCLISQRPVRLSATALSQCNTHLIMRVRNPYDLDYLGRLSEGLDRDTLRFIPDLDVGEGLLVGEAVNYPVLFRVRRKKFQTGQFETSLESELRRFETPED